MGLISTLVSVHWYKIINVHALVEGGRLATDLRDHLTHRSISRMYLAAGRSVYCGLYR